MAKMLVLYYSSWGHVETMAHAQAEGVAKVPGMSVQVKRVPELVPDDVAKQFHYKLDQEAPLADPLELGMCRFQGEHVAGIVRDLVAGRKGGAR